MIEIHGIPPRFQSYREKVYRTDGQVEKINRAVNSVLQGKSLFLSGVPGSGKTHLAVRLLYSATNSIDDKRAETIAGQFVTRGLFLPSVEFFLNLRATYSDGQSESGYLEEVSSNRVLVLDDVGAEKVTDWSRQMFYLLIDRYYRSEFQLIVTSNLSLAQLAGTFDDRVSSRLVEMGECLTLKDDDHRTKGKKREDN
jgi:DNA replication protein DnaC